MQFIYNDCSNKAGIYQIRNTLNGRIYVGSTYCFKKRWYQHNRDLNLNKHSNKFLQSDFNKCGTEAFVFEALEVIADKELRRNAEQQLIDSKFDNCVNCYNLQKKAGIYTGTNRKTFKLSEEHKQKIGAANKGTKRSQETKEKLRQLALNMSVEKREEIAKTLTGRKNGPCSDERKQRISSANKGSKRTPEQRQKMSEAAKRRAPMSAETREKIRANSILMHQKRKGDSEPSPNSPTPSA